jgi:hypothetical protein
MELVEEAVHLLRRAPAGLLAGYYFGSLPFVLGLLYFWADMSRSPFAARHLSGSALGLALLFLWMKFWQAVFAANLRARAAGSPPPRWNPRRCARLCIIQGALQPSAAVMFSVVLSVPGVLMLPAALLLAILSNWVYPFYQNVTALGDGEEREVTAVLKRAWRQCLLRPAQNFAILLILAAFGFFVFLNLAMVCFSLPGLLKMMLGVDSVYAQSPGSMLNTTFFAAVFGLAYLCVDPIVKAVYVLRCFYGESLKSGEDLKAELKGFAPSAKMAAMLLVSVLGLASAPVLRAADGPATPPVAGAPAANAKISPPQLDRAIDGVIHQTKYAWRMPREKVVDDDTTAQGPVGRFIERAMNWIKGEIKSFMEWLTGWLNRWFRRHASGGDEPRTDWVGSLHALVYVLLALVICALVIFIMRAWHLSQRRGAPVASEAIPMVPDLTDENVGAEQLPEDGWLKLGRELLERGEFRLALRAFYFASLAHLAARSLITIAKFKSNRDYERELGRRGHSLPELVSSFGENVVVFDRSWYGLHEVDAGLVGRFIVNVERIKAF